MKKILVGIFLLMTCFIAYLLNINAYANINNSYISLTTSEKEKPDVTGMEEMEANLDQLMAEEASGEIIIEIEISFDSSILPKNLSALPEKANILSKSTIGNFETAEVTC